MLPQTWVQVAVLAAAVVPGFVHQITRRRVGGPGPDEVDVTVRILRSLVGSATYAGVYLIVLGPMIQPYATTPGLAASNVRVFGVWALALAVAVPWATATAWTYIRTSDTYGARVAQLRRSLGLVRRWDPTPSGWDAAFKVQEHCWVRVLTADGHWVGGWFSADSYATSFPDPPELFIEVGYVMTPAGELTNEVSAPSGVLVRGEIVLVDFLPAVSEFEEDDGA